MSECDKLAKELRIFFNLIGVICLLCFLCVLLGIGKDTTDGETRSGMSLHIDAMTGCHYLAKGSLTPRLNKEGNHVCYDPDAIK